MTKTTAGWLGFLAALVMMAGLMAPEVAKLPTWSAATTPAFVSLILAHFTAVGAAFFAGKFIPTEREPGLLTRSTDHNVPDVVTAPPPAPQTVPPSHLTM